MIIIDVKEEESIDRALKRYKRKHRNIRLANQLRARKFFTKKSVKKREEKLSAAYRLEKFGDK
jgi:small subunit ribosomal protein S21